MNNNTYKKIKLGGWDCMENKLLRKVIKRIIKKQIKKHMEEDKEEKSEFGSGFVYNLVLFAKHWNAMSEMREYYKKQGEPEERFYSSWFNGSSDHLYDIEVPEVFKGTEIETMVKELKDTSLDLGHGSGLIDDIATKRDFQRVFELTEKIAFEIDKYLKVNPIKAEYN